MGRTIASMVVNTDDLLARVQGPLRKRLEQAVAGLPGTGLKARADRALTQDWPVLTATGYLDFARTGTRQTFETKTRTRRDILRRCVTGEPSVSRLAHAYPMSFAAVQKHVAVLERAGLVTKQRIGRRKVVRTNVEGLRVAQRLLERYEQLWRERIDRMTDLISDDTKEIHR